MVLDLEGEKLVDCFRPFLEYLVACADLSPKTIQKHVDNLWVLGGEIIRDLNETPSLRKKNIENARNHCESGVAEISAPARMRML